MKRCNGYYHICQYKGIPICSFELEWPDGKTAVERLCKECAKEHAKKHPDLKEGIEKAIITHSAVKALLKKEAVE